MQKRFQAFALPALAATGLALVSNAAVELIPPSQLTAYAPTEFDTNRTAMKAVNGAGMNANGLTHNAAKP